jgi:hypothetical protein
MKNLIIGLITSITLIFGLFWLLSSGIGCKKSNKMHGFYLEFERYADSSHKYLSIDPDLSYRYWDTAIMKSDSFDYYYNQQAISKLFPAK